MNLMRWAALAASTTVVLTAVGAVTGVAGPAANAYEISGSFEVVVLQLSAEETTAASAQDDTAYDICYPAITDVYRAAGILIPISSLDCETRVHECALYAEGKPAAVVFYWTSEECRI